jgi:hypothetical protein
VTITARATFLSHVDAASLDHTANEFPLTFAKTAISLKRVQKRVCRILSLNGEVRIHTLKLTNKLGTGLAPVSWRGEGLGSEYLI